MNIVRFVLQTRRFRWLAAQDRLRQANELVAAAEQDMRNSAQQVSVGGLPARLYPREVAVRTLLQLIRARALVEQAAEENPDLPFLSFSNPYLQQVIMQLAQLIRIAPGGGTLPMVQSEGAWNQLVDNLPRARLVWDTLIARIRP